MIQHYGQVESPKLRWMIISYMILKLVTISKIRYWENLAANREVRYNILTKARAHNVLSYHVYGSI